MSTSGVDEGGAQRHSLERLRRWEGLGYGMFIHFGMSTFVQEADHSQFAMKYGANPPERYAPTDLDVDQWISTAAEAGMRYAVLTAKHHAGHCLWPSRLTESSVANSPDATDVVAAYTEACRRHGIAAGIYYSILDDFHQFGSPRVFAMMGGPAGAARLPTYVTAEYIEFARGQLDELLIGYGPIEELWLDIPNLLGNAGRRAIYDHVAAISPDTVVVMNAGQSDGTTLNVEYSWPSDVHTIESALPSVGVEQWMRTGLHGYQPWHDLVSERGVEERYYMPGEVCEGIGKGYEWFRDDGNELKSDAELLGIRLVCKERGTNLLLNVPPDTSGRIPQEMVDSLGRLRRNFEPFA
jgi:alpha-L-fucosidase